MPEPSALDLLGAYLAERAQQRIDNTLQTLLALTERERQLVRDAAVLGYAQGAWAHGGTRASIPPDSAIVAQILVGCRSMPDLYPTLGRAHRPGTDRQAEADHG